MKEEDTRYRVCDTDKYANRRAKFGQLYRSIRSRSGEIRNVIVTEKKKVAIQIRKAMGSDRQALLRKIDGRRNNVTNHATTARDISIVGFITPSPDL